MIQALYTISGEDNNTSLVKEFEIRKFLNKFRKEAVFTFQAIFILCLIVWAITPLFTVFIPLPAFFLPKQMREKHTCRLTTSRVYLFRQCMVLLKQFVGLIWGANNQVRHSLRLKEYSPDPDKFKVGPSGNGHISFVSKGQNKRILELEADYVIVGSGAGGSAAAVELARAGLNIAIVESGPWLEPQNYPNSLYGAMKNTFDNWGANATLGKTFSPIVQARCIGGTPVINSSIVVRTPADIFELWREKYGLDISNRQIWEIQEKIEKELCVEKVSETYFGQNNQLAMKADKFLKINGSITDRNVKDCQGSGNCLYGCKANKKQSPNVTWIPEILSRRNVVLSCAPVNKIIINNGKAEKVQGNFIHPYTQEIGCKFIISAKKGIILAASATHTPCILQRSGLNLPALGKHFQAHPGSTVIGLYPNPVADKKLIGATQGWSTAKFKYAGFKLETLNLPLELLISRLPGAGINFKNMLASSSHMALWIAVVQADNSEGYVRYNKILKNPEVHYIMSEKDVIKLRQGMYTLAKMHFAAGALAVLPGIYGLPHAIRENETDLILNASLNPQNYVTILSHLFGGAVMGADPQNSVCDSNGKVHGTEGLYIADASAIPTVLGVNPQHTIMALAMRLAHHLIYKKNE